MKTKLSFTAIIGLLVFIVITGFISKKIKEPKQKYILIENAKITLDSSVISLGKYWISNYEVTNVEYRKFLQFLKKNNRMDDYSIANIDSLGWDMEYHFCTPMVDYYHVHPAYNNYPVVNISHKAAEMYCQWLTSQDEKQLYKYSLPTKSQWIYAASSGNRFFVYPWGGPYLKSGKGEYLCSYLRIGDIGITKDSTGKLIVNLNNGITSSYNTITYDFSTTAVNSYLPNDFGLYNVSGNAAEMIKEDGIALGGSWNSPGYDVRIRSEEKYSGSASTIGFRVVRTLRD